jgi:hypothetical protein
MFFDRVSNVASVGLAGKNLSICFYGLRQYEGPCPDICSNVKDNGAGRDLAGQKLKVRIKMPTEGVEKLGMTMPMRRKKHLEWSTSKLMIAPFERRQ